MQSRPRRLKEDEGIGRRDWQEKTPKDETNRKQNEMGRTGAKIGRKQTVKKSMESRRGWQKKKTKIKSATERQTEILKGQVLKAKRGRLSQKTEGGGEREQDEEEVV